MVLKCTGHSCSCRLHNSQKCKKKIEENVLFYFLLEKVFLQPQLLYGGSGNEVRDAYELYQAYAIDFSSLHITLATERAFL